MIPISLTLQGIYSYQAKQTIDFTRLTAAGIFGIFGSVGSGKSTIIEAITYALYGRTDRLNLSGDNRNYNMMNLKSNDLFIEFVFRAGEEQTEYMATVKSRRNSKQFEEVKAIERNAYKKADGKWNPLEVESLEKIIGLSYENFKRTVIIPQGKFQEFLLLGNKERTQMMKELFNLEKYELYYKVVSLETKTSQQKQIIEGHLQQLGEITADQISATGILLQEAKKEIEVKSQEHMLKQQEEIQLRKLKELVSKAKQLELQVQTLKIREPAIALQEKTIATYEYCQVHFKGLLENLKTSEHNIKQFQAGIHSDEARLKEITSQLTALETNFETARIAFEGREILKQQAEELSKIAKIIELQKQQLAFTDRISKGEKALDENRKLVDILKSNQEKFMVEIRDSKSRLPDMNRLSGAKEWFSIHNLLQKAGKEIESEWTALKAEIDALNQQKALLYNSDCFTGISVLANYEDVLAQLEAKKQKHRSVIEVLNQEKQHLNVQLKLTAYATDLEEGKPCPLCGSLSHPDIYKAEDISHALKKNLEEHSMQDKLILEIESGQKKLSEVNTAYCIKEDLLSKVLKKQKEQQDKLSAHQQLFNWEEFRDEAEVSKAFTNAEKLQTIVKANEEEIEKLRIQLDAELANKEKFTKAIDDFKTNSTRISAEANILREQLSQLKFSDFENATASEIIESKNQLLKQYSEIESGYQTLLRRIADLKEIKNTLTGSLGANKSSLEKELNVQVELNRRVHEQLEISGYNTLDEVTRVISLNLDLDAERKKVNIFRQELDFAQKQMVLVQDEINDQQFDEVKYQELLGFIQKLSEEIKLKNQYQGQLESELRKLIEDLEKKSRLQELFTSLELRLEDIKTLKQLFKASGFVNYISSVYLQELCHSANERFYKLSGQKLSLEVTEENDFEVRDFMNGGKVRSVKTLSGGQTFQAALSLALALSDNTRQVSGSDENFFFLDEGFGSLDKESLDVVFDTLKSLRRENRIVGIISHVEEMQQEIDVHLRIKNFEEMGSIIIRSWDGA